MIFLNSSIRLWVFIEDYDEIADLIMIMMQQENNEPIG